MNLLNSANNEAKLLYLDAEYDIISPGGYVVCAVTKKPIPLPALKYWNVDKQEAYFDAAAAAIGYGLKSQ